MTLAVPVASRFRRKPRCRQRSARVALAFALSLGGGRAVEAAPATRLVYSRGPGAEACADETALRKAVAARVGYDPFFPWAKTTVIVSVRRITGVYHAHIELLDADGIVRGMRELSDRHEECTEIVSAMALGISIALDTLDPGPPRRELETDPPAPKEESVPVSEPVTAGDVPPFPERAESSPPPTPQTTLGKDELDLGAAALAVIGGLPAPVLGAAASARYRRDRLSVGLEVGGGLPGSKTGPLGSEASLYTLFGDAVPCLHAASLAVCGVGSVTMLRATAPEPRETTFVAVGVRGALELPLSDRWAVGLRLDVVAPLRSVTLRVDGSDVWRMPSIQTRFGLGFSHRFR